MNRKRILFVINPISGTSRKKHAVRELSSLLDPDQFSCMYYDWEHEPALETDLPLLIQQDVDAIVVAGGDGTLNRVVNLAYPKITQFGIIPLGSGNGLARYLRIPFDPKAAMLRINELHSRSSDLGRFGNKLFTNVAGIGFDAQVAYGYNKNGVRGLRGYVRESFRSYFKNRSTRFQFQDSGKTIELEAFICSFANGSQWGNNFYISPDSRINDHSLEMVMIPSIRFMQIPRLFLEMRRGKPLHISSRRSVTHLRLFLSEQIPYHVDGESGLIEGEVVVECIPDAIHFIN